MQKMVKDGYSGIAVHTEQDDDSIDLFRVLSVLRRRWFVLFAGLMTGFILGLAHVLTTTPVYTSSVQINIGSPDAENAREMSGVSGISLDEDQITTEIQVLLSEQIAARVVDRLDLVHNEVFQTQSQSGVGRVVGLIKAPIAGALGVVKSFLREDVPPIELTEEELEMEERQEAIDLLRESITVNRVELSRVLNVSFTSVSPQVSARIANAVANAYIEDQLASKYDATQRATDWLKERSDQLRIQSKMLDNAVENFRRKNGLIGYDGELTSDSVLEDLTQQLSDARADLVSLEARSNRLEEIVLQNDMNAAVSSTATQSITANIRARYLDTLRDYNRLVTSLGEDHEQTVIRRDELDQLQGLLFEEIKRSAAVARNDVKVAREQVANLEAAQVDAEQKLGADNETLVELRELERNAETVRNLYTSFLQRYQQSLQEQGFPVSEARVLNAARVPEDPSAPSMKKWAAMAGFLGLFLAIGWVAIREVLDTKLRTEAQIRNVLGLEYFGGLERLSAKTANTKKQLAELKEHEVLFPEVMRYSAEKPLSGFSETLRTSKMSVTLKAHSGESRGQIVGIVSSFPGEGKTTTSANFASLVASQGSSVLLIDGDMRNPGLTRALGRDVEKGLVDVLVDGVDPKDVICLEKITGVHVLPNRRGRVVHTSELLGGEAMASLLESAAESYDFVVVDLPPLGPVIDARAVLHKLDGLFFVTRWGTTNINYAQNVLRSDPRLIYKCYGAFLNMFDAKQASAYGSYEGASYYYGKGYARYYNDR